MSINSSLVGGNPIKSFVLHATDIPFIVDMRDIDNPVVQGMTDFSVVKVVNEDDTFYFTVPTACPASVVCTYPTISNVTGITFSFAIKNIDNLLEDPTNFTGVQFILRGANGVPGSN
jgi:hypothetical protein